MKLRRSLGLAFSLLALLALLALLVAAPAPAIDHTDGPLSMDVLDGQLAGPPYPASPVVIDVALRSPGSGPTPAGEMHWSLVSAVAPSSGVDIPLRGEAADNGDPFGEPGDTVAIDVYFVPGAPPNEDLTVVAPFLWAQHAESDGASGPMLEFTGATPMTMQFEFFFDDYEVEVRDPVNAALLGTARMRNRFEIEVGQDLEFGNVMRTGPDANGDVQYSGELLRIPGGSIDPSKPLYHITVSSEPAQPVPALAPMAAGILSVSLGMAGIALRR